MAVSHKVRQVLRLYTQHIDSGTVSTRLRQLWNILSNNQKTQLNALLDQRLLATLLYNVSDSELEAILSELTLQQKTAIFDVIKTDLVGFLQTDHDSEIDLVNNTDID
jgi:hypothetical protein